jgi:hypothetical protein
LIKACLRAFAIALNGLSTLVSPNHLIDSIRAVLHNVFNSPVSAKSQTDQHENIIFSLIKVFVEGQGDLLNKAHKDSLADQGNLLSGEKLLFCMGMGVIGLQF